MGNVIGMVDIMRMKIYDGTPPAKGERGGVVMVDCVERSGLRHSYHLNPRLDLVTHYYPGFTWGSGSGRAGAAQTAIAILADALRNDELALRHYQRFADDVVAVLDSNSQLLIDDQIVRATVDRFEIERGSQHLQGELYDRASLAGAATGHLPLIGTDVELVAYKTGDDLCVMVNKGPKCCYRALLKGVMRAGFAEADTGPLCESFVIHDLGRRQ